MKEVGRKNTDKNLMVYFTHRWFFSLFIFCVLCGGIRALGTATLDVRADCAVVLAEVTRSLHHVLRGEEIDPFGAARRRLLRTVGTKDIVEVSAENSLTRFESEWTHVLAPNLTPSERWRRAKAFREKWKLSAEQLLELLLPYARFGKTKIAAREMLEDPTMEDSGLLSQFIDNEPGGSAKTNEALEALAKRVIPNKAAH